MLIKVKVYKIGFIILALLITIILISYPSKKMLENEGDFLEYVDIDRAYEHIKYLSENICVRVAGSKEEKLTADYIYTQFKSMGYNVNIQNFKHVLGKSRNIEAIKTPSGKDSNDTDEIVYITAHYDSFENSPGANDNASGIACILEIASIIKDLDIDREIRFVAFGSEELGLLGSSNYVYKLKDNEIEKSIACFNLDMVVTSYKGIDEIRAYTVDGNNNIVTDAIYEARKVFNSDEYISEKNLYNDTYNGEIDALSQSDHYNFDTVDIPSALFINVNPNTGKVVEPYMHTANDTTENISLQKLERSINLIGKAIYKTVND